MQVRAAILVRTLSLVNGNSRVRLSIVDALINALNDIKHIQLTANPIDRFVLRQLADAMAGECTTPFSLRTISRTLQEAQ